MEKRDIINLDAWLKLRAIRNEFTHEYPDENAEKAANLNNAWQAVAILQGIVTAISDYIEQQHGFDIKQCD